ncbi:MAG: hypothetical protein JRI23_30805 [Deltaproteobacteria bacterium]|jgi:hypothetical protein|nr:hypothetical protein [Deltaproteobacteria bacterium]MBW2536585.1 hypothetical protein [Deltaproteobacteria bacterium]
MKLRTAAIVVATAFPMMMSLGCGEEAKPYKPKPAYSGKRPSLPAVPTLPNKKKKIGDAYTVWGATHDLRSKVHKDDFRDKQITIVGWIVKTNYEDAPDCAMHKTGKADPPDCKAPVPTFWIADDQGEKKNMIPVMGFASNFAQLYTLIEGIDKAPKGEEDEVKLMDEFWGMDLPNPVPEVGGKVKITGYYGVTFTKATKGAAANPKYGIMTAEKIEFEEPPPKRAVLRGMKLSKTD